MYSPVLLLATSATEARNLQSLPAVPTLADLRACLTGPDNVPTGGSASDFARQIAVESENNARIIRAAGIKGE